MNDVETTVWALVYAAAVVARDPDPGSVADEALQHYNAMQLDIENERRTKD